MFQTHHSLAGRNERYANNPFDGPKLKPVRPAAIGAKVALLAGDGYTRGRWQRDSIFQSRNEPEIGI